MAGYHDALTIQTHLRILGAVLVLLVPINTVAIVRLDVAAELDRVSSLTRTVFYSHYLASMLIAIGSAALALLYPEQLIAQALSAPPVTAALACFWLFRFAVQTVFYAPRLKEFELSRGLLHLGGMVVYGYAAVIFSGAWWVQAHTESFPDLRVINRGFGGSEMADAARYASRIVVPLLTSHRGAL
jgi:hypothetical protein